MPRNIFKIHDGRNYFWQWDTNQKLIVLDGQVDKVHFSCKGMDQTISRDVLTDENGLRTCDIPDELLAQPKNLTATAYIIDAKRHSSLASVMFAVKKRPMPENYIDNNA